MKKYVLLASLLLAACGGEDVSPTYGETTGTAGIEPAPQPQRPNSAASTQKSHPFHGIWADTETDCSLEPGAAENAPVAFTPDQFTAFNNNCAIEKVVVIRGETAFNALVECVAEGTADKLDLYLRLTDENLTLDAGNGTSVTWTRCPSTFLSE